MLLLPFRIVLRELLRGRAVQVQHLPGNPSASYIHAGSGSTEQPPPAPASNDGGKVTAFTVATAAWRGLHGPAGAVHQWWWHADGD